MKTLYTDASFDWNQTEKTKENVVRGKIAISDGISFERIDKVAIGKVPELKQYINILELFAIARAIEIASEMRREESGSCKCLSCNGECFGCNECHQENFNALTIFTDSQTAMYWARNGIESKETATEAHNNALEYLRRARIQFGGEITFNFIGRNENPAGKLLEIELEKESPHA